MRAPLVFLNPGFAAWADSPGPGRLIPGPRGRNGSGGPARRKGRKRFQTPDINHQLTAVLQQRFGVRQADPMGLRQVVHLEVRLGQFQRPGQMVDLQARDSPAPVRGKQRIAIRQEAFQATLQARLPQTPIARPEACRPPGQQSLTAVAEFPFAGRLDLHAGPVVRQPKEHPRRADRKRVRRVQRKKVDPRLTCLPVPHIGPQVELRETARTRNGRQPSEAYVIHPERHHTHPGRPVKNVDRQALGNQVRQFSSGKGPVSKQQIAPSLGHHPGGLRQWPGTMLGRGQDFVHAPGPPRVLISAPRQNTHYGTRSFLSGV